MIHNISKGTITRTIMIIIVLINLILEKFGIDIIDTSESFVASIVEMIIEAASIVVSWWYNNSYTENARKADRFLKALKENSKNEN